MKNRTVKSLEAMVADFKSYEFDDREWEQVLADWEAGEIIFVLENAIKLIKKGTP